MSEIRNVMTRQVDERCPVCGNGWLRPTGISFTSNPPQYEHKCTKCEYKAMYSVRYPYIIYE